MSAKITVVVVSWNSREHIGACLEALRRLGPRGRVIVVDNASSDGTADMVEEVHPDVHVIRNSANLGFAGGVNVGLRAARSPFVLLLNPDAVVEPGCIEGLLEYARAHPRAAVIGPRVKDGSGRDQSSAFRFPSVPNMLLAATYLYKLFPRSPFLNRERYGGMDPAQARPVDVVSGCCFFVRTDVMGQVGLLDEDFFMYAEETDFCFRARAAGHEVHYAPVGSVVHTGAGSSRHVRKAMFVEFRRSLLHFFSKHRRPLSRPAARALLFLFLAIRLPYWMARSLQPGPRGARARNKASAYLAGGIYLLTGRGVSVGACGTVSRRARCGASGRGTLEPAGTVESTP